MGYALYYIASNSPAQHRMREEFSSLEKPNTASSNVDHPDDSYELHHNSTFRQQRFASSLETLPYLTCVLKESYRMRPNSTPLPRVTPSTHSVHLAGVEGIPPGTRVNTFQWLLHRDPHRWSAVDEWLPERWLDHCDGSSTKSDGDVLWPFGEFQYV
jgi:unspecific monooxygenase